MKRQLKLKKKMKKNEGNLIRLFIQQENESKRDDFKFQGYRRKRNRYTQEQKDYAINLAQEKGVRATARILKLHRKTIQR